LVISAPDHGDGGAAALFAAFVAGGVLAEAVPPRVVVLAWMDTMRAETAPSSRAALMDLEVTRGARPAGSRHGPDVPDVKARGSGLTAPGCADGW